MNVVGDERPEVRVFIASSQDVEAERRQFEAMIGRIGAREHIARRCRLVPRHWQQSSRTADGDLQGAIFAAMKFDAIQVVLVVVAGYVGPGTRAEYEAARALRSQQGHWPAIAAFFKAAPNGVDLVGDAAVGAFHRQVLEDGVVVPGNFRTVEELERAVADLIEDLIPSVPTRAAATGEALRTGFLACGAVAMALTVALLLVTQTMTFPGANTTQGRVLFVLAGPPLLFVLGWVQCSRLRRLITEFRFAWSSPEYADERIFQVFRYVFPRSVIPPPLRDRFFRDRLGEVLTWVLLLTMFFGPLVAQYNCVFRELLTWSFAVDPDVLVAAPTTPNAPVQSRFVERGPLTFPYALRSPDVAARHTAGSIIFVYSEFGNLGWDESPAAEPFRRNIGPQVFLPQQPLLYVALFWLQGLLAAASLLRLLRLSRLVRTPIVRGSP